MTDFHDYEGRLSKYLQRLEREQFSRKDRTLIRDYIYHCRAQDISTGRLFKIAWTLIGIRRLLRIDFKKANRKDVEQLIGDINSSGRYSPDTKSDFKKILKKFYKYVRNGNADKLTAYPPEVAWIQTSIKRNEVKEPDLISEDEAKKMIEAETR